MLTALHSYGVYSYGWPAGQLWFSVFLQSIRAVMVFTADETPGNE